MQRVCAFGGKPTAGFTTSCSNNRQRRVTRTASGPGDKQPSGGGMINEDVLRRLQQAEEEAARLRKELAAAQGKAPLGKDAVEGKAKRVDSVDKRESLFAAKQDRVAWLNEADVEFFTGNAPAEGAVVSEQLDPEAQATIQRRLLIGIGLTVGLGAFALVPTQQLQFKPSKPMYFYLVPILRAQSLLVECQQIIADADWPTLRVALPRIRETPNNIKSNMDSVAALMDDTRTAEKAATIASEFMEYLDAMDYQKYFDAMPLRGGITGEQNAKFVDFSGRAAKAALGKLDAFLALVPRQALADAQAQITV